MKEIKHIRQLLIARVWLRQQGRIAMQLCRVLEINEYPLMVYGTADPNNENKSELFFCSSLNDVRGLTRVPEHIRSQLVAGAIRRGFPKSSPYPMVEIRGGASLKIGLILTQFFDADAPIQDATKTLSGYWLPPVPDFGVIIIWQAELSDHRVAIAFSQAQAIMMLKDFHSWLDVNKRAVMLINTLQSVLPEHSHRAPQTFGGLAAALIHQAALYAGQLEQAQHSTRN